MKYFQRSLSLAHDLHIIVWRINVLPCPGTEHQAPERASPQRTGYPASVWMKITDLICFMGLLHLSIVTFFVFFRESLDRMRCLSCRRTSKNAREFPSFFIEVMSISDPKGPNDGVRWGTPYSYLEYSLSVFSLPKLKREKRCFWF